MRLLRHPVLRWLLTCILLCAMLYQLWSRSDHFQAFRIESFRQAGWYILLVVMLMPVNWWLETLKWHQFLSRHTRIPFHKASKAVTSGIALSIFTPSRIGEYGGRLLFMPYAIRWPVAISTMMGSICQNLVGFLAGILSLVILFQDLFFLKLIALGSAVVAFFCFFRMKFVIHRICKLNLHPAFKKLAQQLAYIGDYSPRLLLKGLGIASIRYLVYSSQFVLLLHAFEPEVSIGVLALGVSGLYLFHTIVPLPPVADVLARTNVALILWSGAGMNELSISLASLLIWTINLLIPAMIGSILLSTTTPGNSFNTHDQHFSPSYEPVIADQTSSP